MVHGVTMDPYAIRRPHSTSGVVAAQRRALADALPDGELLLAVGDVAGHGIGAAAAMVRLRHAMSALACAGHGPAEILAVLNHLLWRQRTDDVAAAVVARYRPENHQLTWARAGHLPILLTTGETVRALWQPAGIALGAVPEASYAHAVSELDSGDLLLMYTDGFVEERGHSIDGGVEVLEDHAHQALRVPSADRPTAVLERLRRPNSSDDACVLAATAL